MKKHKLGFGKVIVGSGVYRGKNLMPTYYVSFEDRDEALPIGVRLEDKNPPGKKATVITFDNTASIDIVIAALKKVKKEMKKHITWTYVVSYKTDPTINEDVRGAS
jgi:hypothetical protein